MFSPSPKLEINELPHHKCLSHADGGQHTDSRGRKKKRQKPSDIKVSDINMFILFKVERKVEKCITVFCMSETAYFTRFHKRIRVILSGLCISKCSYIGNVIFICI